MWKHAHLSASLSEWSLPRSFLWLSVASRKKKGSAENATLVCSEVTSSKFHNFCQAELPAGFQREGALVYCTCRDLGRTEVNLRIRPCNFFILQYPPGNLFASRHIPQNISPASPAVASATKKSAAFPQEVPLLPCCFAPRRHDFAMACATQIPTQIGEQQIQLLEGSRWIHNDHRGPGPRFHQHSNSVGHPKKVKVISGWGTQTGKTTTLGIWNQQVECLPYVLLVASWTVLDLWTYTFDQLSRPRIKLKAVKCSIETSSNHPQRQPRINNPLGCWKMGGYHWSIRLSLPAGYPLKYPIIINHGLWIWVWHYRILFHNSQPSARRFQILQGGSIWTFANPFGRAAVETSAISHQGLPMVGLRYDSLVP